MEIFKSSLCYNRKVISDNKHEYRMSYLSLYKYDKTASLYLDKYMKNRSSEIPENYMMIFDKYSITYKVITSLYILRDNLKRLLSRIKSFLFKNSMEATLESLKNIDTIKTRDYYNGYETEETIEV